MSDLRCALQHLEEAPGDTARLATVQTLVRQYAEFHWSHMRIEEEQVFPLAMSRLLPEDWQEIDAACCHNEDPLIGLDAKRESRSEERRIGKGGGRTRRYGEEVEHKKKKKENE